MQLVGQFAPRAMWPFLIELCRPGAFHATMITLMKEVTVGAMGIVVVRTLTVAATWIIAAIIKVVVTAKRF